MTDRSNAVLDDSTLKRIDDLICHLTISRLIVTHAHRQGSQFVQMSRQLCTGTTVCDHGYHMRRIAVVFVKRSACTRASTYGIPLTKYCLDLSNLRRKLPLSLRFVGHSAPLSPNARVERPRDERGCAPGTPDGVPRSRRARDDASRTARTRC